MKFAATRIGGLVVDVAVLASAYLGSFILRFDFTEPRWGWRAVAMSFVTVCAVSVISLLICGCYRFSWRHFHLRDVPRFSLLYAIPMCLSRAFCKSFVFFVFFRIFIHVFHGISCFLCKLTGAAAFACE